MTNIEFGNYKGKPLKWNVLKKEKGSHLLVGDKDNTIRCNSFLSPFYDVETFWYKVREYLHVEIFDSGFSEIEKHHIVCVRNAYPFETQRMVKGGFAKTFYKAENRKDRIFPLIYDDIREMEQDDLQKIHVLHENQKVILLNTATESSEQSLSYICPVYNYSGSYYGNTISSKGYYEVCRDENSHFFIKPAIWVNGVVK